MKAIELTDSEIYTIIDSEISNGRLDRGCKEMAERDSGGNYDLMISKYFLKRVEELRGKKGFSDDRAEALDQRKIAAAKKILSSGEVKQRDTNISNRSHSFGVFNLIFGNLVLIGSSASAVIAYLISNGESVSYSVIGVVAAICIFLPVFLSQLPVIKNLISYRVSLAVLGIIMCLIYIIHGLLLIGNDSPITDDAEMRVNSGGHENGRGGNI